MARPHVEKVGILNTARKRGYEAGKIAYTAYLEDRYHRLSKTWGRGGRFAHNKISKEDYFRKYSYDKFLASDYKGRGISTLQKEADRRRAERAAQIAQAQRNLARRGKAKDDPGQSAQLSIGRGSKRGRISLRVDDVTSRKKRTRASRISSATGLSIGI